MKLTKIVISITISLIFIVTSAQEYTDVTSYAPRDWTIIPPAPEVASMMRSVDYPVAPFTGQPDISFPIYTIDKDDGRMESSLIDDESCEID